ncbi:bifunctional DNA primase/polymerase [Microlunatus speluncae]|uniref:bifunctional DNA primase/polymerase n=1 Tax=Microlunatus speluncae TaxID=2594267 RepID=UPI0012660CC1|nr:bifunctional DNA primase/polymerase [Microlunatus speluncae]
MERGAVSSVLVQTAESLPPAAAARELARAGVAVFPCESHGKRPATEHGFHDATSEIARVDAWWRQMPQANIGIPTGAVSGVVVIDVDVHGQVDGFSSFDRARRAGLVGGWELLVRTPSGGMHAYYPSTPDTAQRSWQAARAGIDFRGSGGYIIVPPSRQVISGAALPYRVETVNTGPAAALDSERLREVLDPRPTPHPRSSDSLRDAEASRLAAWVSSRHEGERNRGLFWAACRLAESGVPPTDALDVLSAAAGLAGLGEREITTTVRSAYRSVHRDVTHRDPPEQQSNRFGHRSHHRSVSARQGLP